MANIIVSAVPKMLYRYADCSTQLDHDLIGTGERLTQTFGHFERHCKEPDFRVSATDSAQRLRRYGEQNLPIDERVRTIGQRFARADGMQAGIKSPTSWINTIKQRLSTFKVRDVVRKAIRFIPLIGPPAWLAMKTGELSWILKQDLFESPSTDTPLRRLMQKQETTSLSGDTILRHLMQEEVSPEYDLSTDSGREKSVHIAEPSKSTASVDNAKKPKARRHISQKHPTGSEGILNLKRKSEGDEKPETVRDHIVRYGCLMTCYTMLLNDIGVSVDVTDLYKEKYKLANPTRDFDRDARDGTIVLSDLFTPLSIIKNVANGKNQQGISGTSGSLSGSTSERRIDSLKKAIDQYGSVVVHVTGDPNYGHWIVVDSYDEDKFSVRDPLKSDLQNNVEFGTKGGYHFHDSEIRYLENRAH
jgi:hypothetical protein